MSRFTFYGDSNRFNPNCTSNLLFDNLDGSTERKFCVESTCVDSIFTATGASANSCRSSMIPAGHTGRKFEWGVEGGPWQPNIDYSVFPASPNEFIAEGARFTEVTPITGVCGWRLTANNQWVLNSAFFSNTWDIQNTSYVGYGAMSNGTNLNSRPVDPSASLGKTEYLPAYGFTTPPGCKVTKTAHDEPEISYYNLGTDPVVPAPHDVVFPDVQIALDPIYIDVSAPTGQAYISTYVTPAGAGPGKCGMTYSSGNHPSFNLASLMASYTYSHASGGNTLSARSYFPTYDRDPLDVVVKGVRNDTKFVTGYRAQNYVQQLHYCEFGQGGSSLCVGLRHLETRMWELGYRAKWFCKSITPTIAFAVGAGAGPGSQVIYYFVAKAAVTLTVSYDKLPIPVGWAGYEYSAYRDEVPVGMQTPYYSSEGYQTPKYNSSSPTRYYNPPWNGWKKEHLANPDNPPAPAINYGTHNLLAVRVATVVSPDLRTHASSGFNSDATNVLDPVNQSKLLYYTRPLSWVAPTTPANLAIWHGTTYNTPVVDSGYISYGGQAFTTHGVVPHPSSQTSYSAYPFTPTNFKIWRRLIGPSGGTAPLNRSVTYGYSDRTEWFNGTCPFDVIYDNDLSSESYSPNGCSTTLVPYIMPT